MLEVGIIGAGPYGLSVAAHLRRTGVSFRIFGRPMDSWLAHMPKGMMLKSDGFASNIYDPEGAFTLKNYCAAQDIDYDSPRISGSSFRRCLGKHLAPLGHLFVSQLAAPCRVGEK
jgi:hypothetical protein